jgi:hypothetical protein
MPKNESATATAVDESGVAVESVDTLLDGSSLESVIFGITENDKPGTTPLEIPDDLVDNEEEKEEDSDDEKKVEESETTETIDETDATSETVDEDAEDLRPIPEIVIENLGLEGVKAEEYPNTIEGVVKLAADAAQKLAEGAVEKAVAVDPTLKEFFDFVAVNGGNPEQFLESRFPKDDFANIELTEDNTPLQKHLVTLELQGRGLSPEEITAEIADYEEAGSLHRWAQRALKGHQEKQAATHSQLVETQTAAAAEAKQKLVDYWSELKEQLNKNNAFLGVTVPESEKDSLFEYMSVPVDESGKTQLLVDSENMSYEEEIAVYWIVKNREKIADLLFSKAQTKLADDLGQILGKGGKRRPKGQTGPSPQSRDQVDRSLETLNLDFLT